MSKFFLTFLLAVYFLLPTSAWANEIPVLNWERGKTQSVVLGGSVREIDWKIYLEGDGSKSKQLDRSFANQAGYFVYTISLPANFPIGRYQIIAKGDSGTTVVGAVQIIERFKYDLTETTRDFIFVLMSFVIFLSMILLLGTWQRVVSIWDSDAKAFAVREKHGLLNALYHQRIRWQSGVLGVENLSAGSRSLPKNILAILPLVSLLLSLSVGLQQAWFLLETRTHLLFFGALVVLGILDKYSARVSGLALFSIFVIFNSTLNLPSLLSYIVLLGTLYIPHFVGDVTKEFLDRGLRTGNRIALIIDGLSSLTVGIAVFWIYLVSESVKGSSITDASRIAPIAIIASLTYFFQKYAFSYSAQTKLDLTQQDAITIPVMNIGTLVLTWLSTFLVINVLSGEILLSILSSFLLVVPLLGTFVRFEAKWKIKSRILVSETFQFTVVLILLCTLLFVWQNIPWLPRDRAVALLPIVGIPLVLLSILRSCADSSHVSLPKEKEDSRT